jgi:ubiquinone/menaquinone biosynthesis C-methylase UbiE
MEKDYDPYQPDNIPLFTAIYGKHLISLGGFQAIDNMFAGLDIQGMAALDLGFGLGGVAFYLAEKYKMHIHGIELYSWMEQYAQDNTPDNIADTVKFDTYTADGHLPYPPAMFDMVYSKGVLNHVADKLTLFQQINTVLKPSGCFVIADWIFNETSASVTPPLVRETKASYTKILLNTGFDEITFRDDSKLFLVYTQELLNQLANSKKFIEQHYGSTLYLTLCDQHQELLKKIKCKEKIATRIVARKYI